MDDPEERNRNALEALLVLAFLSEGPSDPTAPAVAEGFDPSPSADVLPWPAWNPPDLHSSDEDDGTLAAA